MDVNVHVYNRLIGFDERKKAARNAGGFRVAFGSVGA
jgi:hypothetical protein